MVRIILIGLLSRPIKNCLVFSRIKIFCSKVRLYSKCKIYVDHTTEPIYHSTILNIKMLLICAASAYLITTTRARICLIGEIRTSDNFLLFV